MTDTPRRSQSPTRCQALQRAAAGQELLEARSGSGCASDPVTLAVAPVLSALLIMVIFAPLVAPRTTPIRQSCCARLKPIGTPGHWLGTDEIGRDLWSRLVYGGRLSLLAGVLPVFLALLVGGFLGILAAMPAASSTR